MNKYKKYHHIVRCTLNLWASANWYKGIDKPNLWQRIYKWRISPKTAYKVAKQIWL